MRENLEILTDRLLIKLISLEYTDDIFREFTKEVAHFLIPQPTGDIKDTINFINESRKNSLAGTDLQLVALDRINGEFLACVGIHASDTKIPELGLWFKKSAWGKGYGKESMAALKKWIENNLDYEKIRYPVFKKNIVSCKIVEFLGGKIFKESLVVNQNGEKLVELEYLINR